MDRSALITLLLTALLPAGGLGRWLMVRRRPSDDRQPFILARFGRWLLQTGTANIRLAYVEQNLRDAKEALTTKTQEYEESRAANTQLRSDIRQLRLDIQEMRQDLSAVAGSGLSIAPTASATARRPQRRSTATARSSPTSAAGNPLVIRGPTQSEALDGTATNDASDP